MMNIALSSLMQPVSFKGLADQSRPCLSQPSQAVKAPIHRSRRTVRLDRFSVHGKAIASEKAVASAAVVRLVEFMALFEQRGYRQQRWPMAIAPVLGWPLSALYAERGRCFLWSTVLFRLGIAAYFRLPAEPPVLWCIIVTALGLFAHVAARAAHAPLAVVTGATLVVALGFVSAKLRAEFVAAPVLPVAISKAVVVGRIVGVEGRARGGRRLWLHVTTIAGLPAALTPARIVVYQ